MTDADELCQCQAADCRAKRRRAYAPTPPTEEPRPWALDSLLDAVQSDMHREQVLALVQEAYDAGQRVSALEAVAAVDRQWCANIDKCTDGELAPAVDATIAELRAAYERVVAERDEARTEIQRLHGVADWAADDAKQVVARLRSDLNQATAIVEAAKAWRHDMGGVVLGHFNQLLADAVDAYRAAPTGGVEG